MGPFLYVTDLHGNRPKYERTLSLALETGAWLVINGGDMSPPGRMPGGQAAVLREFPFRLKDRARRDSEKFAFPEQFGGAILSRPGGWEEIPDWEAYARALPTIEEELAALPAPEDPARAVYVIHGPPAGLGVAGGGGG